MPDALPAIAPTTHVLLVRHTAVDSAVKGKCYGRSDVSLSKDGAAHAQDLAVRLAALQPSAIVHSGLMRARILAEGAGRHASLDVQVDARLQEFHFGEWELKPWAEIFARVGHRMSDLIHKPETYRPPGGETVNEMAARVLAWFAEQAVREGGDAPTGPVIAVMHGGPISVIRGTLADLPPADWPNLVPDYGAVVRGDGTVMEI